MATPVPVQHVGTTNTITSSFSALHLFFPNKTLSGNCIIVGVVLADGVTATCTDDQSNTYTTAKSFDDTTGGLIGYVFICPNATAGARHITITPSAASTFGQAAMSEYRNIALTSPLDGTPTGARATGTSHQAGAVTTTAASSLVWSMFGDNTGVPANMGSAMTADVANGMAWIHADQLTGFSVQAGVKATAGAIDPNHTTPSAQNGLVITIALKSAAAGTAPDPTAIRVVRVNWFNFNTALTSPVVLNTPCSGNLQVAAFVGFTALLSARYITAINDTNGNGWRGVSPEMSTPNYQGGDSAIWYSGNALPSADQVTTFTMKGVEGASTLVYYDIENADLAPFDYATQEIGAQAVAADLTAGHITPRTPNGLVIASLGVNIGAIHSLNGAAYLADNPYTPEENGGQNAFHQDNGWGHVYNADVAPLVFVWTNSQPAGGMKDWSITLAAFKSVQFRPPMAVAIQRRF